MNQPSIKILVYIEVYSTKQLQTQNPPHILHLNYVGTPYLVHGPMIHLSYMWTGQKVRETSENKAHEINPGIKSSF